MAAISAAAVKALRDKTQLPMMDCKQALQESGGDEEAAIRWLREHGHKTMGKRSDRSTSEGWIGVYASFDPPVGAMVELQCESAPVAKNEEFQQLAADLAERLATGSGAATPDELLAQDSVSKSGTPLKDQLEELQNRIREVFRLQKILRVEQACGSYVHHDGKIGVLLEVEGGTPEAAREVCMHIAAMRPSAVNVDQLDKTLVDKEREILAGAARKEGKPENIIEKMVEGRLRNFFAETVLEEQPFVKDEKQTVGTYAKGAGMKLLQFHCWQLGDE